MNTDKAAGITMYSLMLHRSLWHDINDKPSTVHNVNIDNEDAVPPGDVSYICREY